MLFVKNHRHNEKDRPEHAEDGLFLFFQRFFFLFPDHFPAACRRVSLVCTGRRPDDLPMIAQGSLTLIHLKKIILHFFVSSVSPKRQFFFRLSLLLFV